MELGTILLLFAGLVLTRDYSCFPFFLVLIREVRVLDSREEEARILGCLVFSLPFFYIWQYDCALLSKYFSTMLLRYS